VAVAIGRIGSFVGATSTIDETGFPSTSMETVSGSTRGRDIRLNDNRYRRRAIEDWGVLAYRHVSFTGGFKA
jgi:hypothetical protein